MRQQRRRPGSAVGLCGTKPASTRVEGGFTFFVFFFNQSNCCFHTTSLADKPSLTHTPPRPSAPPFINLKNPNPSNWTGAAVAGGHTPLHSHNGPWHNRWGGPRHRQHSGVLPRGRLPAGYQQTRLVPVCLHSLKGKNVFPHNMAVWGLRPILSGPGSCSRC